MVTSKKSDNTTSLGKANVVFFYCISLLVHIMYMIHNKATLMVNEIINPIIRNAINSTIYLTSLLSIKSSIGGNTHLLFSFLCKLFYNISIKKSIFYNKIIHSFLLLKFLQFLLSLVYTILYLLEICY